MLGSSFNSTQVESKLGRKASMNRRDLPYLALLFAWAALLMPGTADALEQKVTIAQVSFHISHPPSSTTQNCFRAARPQLPVSTLLT